MLAHGPLSGQPLASVAGYLPRTRIVVVPCQPAAVLQRLHRTLAVALEVFGEKVEYVVCMRDAAATAVLVSMGGGLLRAMVMGARPTAQATNGMAVGRVVCSRATPHAVDVSPQLRCETTQHGAIASEQTPIAQPIMQPKTIMAIPHVC